MTVQSRLNPHATPYVPHQQNPNFKTTICSNTNGSMGVCPFQLYRACSFAHVGECLLEHNTGNERCWHTGERMIVTHEMHRNAIDQRIHAQLYAVYCCQRCLYPS